MIPGNDDAIRSIRLFVSAIADAAIAGKAEFQGEVSADDFVEVETPPETDVAAELAATSEEVEPAPVPESAPAEANEKAGPENSE